MFFIVVKCFYLSVDNSSSQFSSNVIMQFKGVLYS